MSTKINMTELYFQWWLETLENKGLVKNIEREPVTFTITDGIHLFYNQHYKTKKPIIKSSTTNQALAYTYDYHAEFNVVLVNKLIGIIGKDNLLNDYDFKGPGNIYQDTLFYATENDIKDGWVKVIFDVKPPAAAARFSGALGSSRDFKYISYLLFNSEHRKFLNKVVPVGTSTSLFNKTFIPERYMFTDGGTKIRKNSEKFDRFEKWAKDKKIVI